MATVAEIQKEIYEKIELLPKESIVDTLKRLLKKYPSTVRSKPSTWFIQSLFGVKIDNEFLSMPFIENLFQNADFEFYLNENKTHLFSQKTELLEHDFGKLTTISAFDAWQYYGMEVLEQAKEKMYVKIK
jgi:hypothetical protein